MNKSKIGLAFRTIGTFSIHIISVKPIFHQAIIGSVEADNAIDLYLGTFQMIY